MTIREAIIRATDALARESNFLALWASEPDMHRHPSIDSLLAKSVELSALASEIEALLLVWRDNPPAAIKEGISS